MKHLFVAVGSFVSLAMNAAGAVAEFRFESVIDLDDMRGQLERDAPLGTAREAVREIFVEQGKAKLYAHPARENVEKYVYDINLCELYIWRWNISANYDRDGRVTQMFLNGEPVHPGGDAAREPEKKSGAKEENLVKAWRPRPEARKGETQLAYILYDLDAGSDAVDDEFISGAGPSRADANDLGVIHAYVAERWRSIFDDEPASAIIPFAGTCN